MATLSKRVRVRDKSKGKASEYKLVYCVTLVHRDKRRFYIQHSRICRDAVEIRIRSGQTSNKCGF